MDRKASEDSVGGSFAGFNKNFDNFVEGGFKSDSYMGWRDILLQIKNCDRKNIPIEKDKIKQYLSRNSPIADEGVMINMKEYSKFIHRYGELVFTLEKAGELKLYEKYMTGKRKDKPDLRLIKMKERKLDITYATVTPNGLFFVLHYGNKKELSVERFNVESKTFSLVSKISL